MYNVLYNSPLAVRFTRVIPFQLRYIFIYDHLFVHLMFPVIHVLSCQPRVTVTSCLVCKIIRDLESIDHLCINPIYTVCHRGFLNISTDEKSRRLLLRLAH